MLRAMRDPLVLAGETVGRAARGDREAFTRLVAEHHGPMARVAIVITGDLELAEDAVQSAWAIAWRRLPTLRDPEQVRSWLVAIAANEARMLVRGRRRRPVTQLSAMSDVGPEPDPGARIGLVDLERALEALDPDDRMLLSLRYVAGLDSAEIASHLGLSASGVRSRLARLLGRLRTELADG
jgi:RNA polymerase sigma-70 factor (ECF subfamily)